MAKIKGVALISRVQMVKEHYGAESLASVFEAMKPQNRGVLDNILFSSWYDAEVFRDINQAISKVLGAKHPGISERMGELTAEAGLKGIYSSKLKDNVLQTLKRASSLYGTFHDSGELVMAEHSDNHAVLQITGYALPHREFCENLIGWGRRLAELSGGKNVEIEENKCVCKGDQLCEMTVRWE